MGPDIGRESEDGLTWGSAEGGSGAVVEGEVVVEVAVLGRFALDDLGDGLGEFDGDIMSADRSCSSERIVSPTVPIGGGRGGLI